MAEEKKGRGRPPGTKNNQSKTTSSRNTSTKKTPTRKSSASKNSGKQNAGAGKKANMQSGSRLKDEIWAIVIIALGIFLVIALQTTAAGELGSVISMGLKGCFGIIALALPYYLILYGLLLFTKRTNHINGRSIFLLILILLMLTILNSARFLESQPSQSFALSYVSQWFFSGINLQSAGAFGMVTGYFFIDIIGKISMCIFAVVVILVSVLLIINTPVSQFIDQLKEKRALKRQESMDYEEEDTYDEDYEDPAKTLIPNNSNKYKTARVASEIMKGRDEIPFERKDLKRDTVELPIMEKLNFDSKIITQNQIKILDYMNDDQLFDTNYAEHASGKLGLEEIETHTPGMGLEPKDPEKIEIGIDQASNLAPGFGINQCPESHTGLEEDNPNTVKKTAALTAEQSHVDEAESTKTTASADKKTQGPIEELHITAEGQSLKPFQLPPIDLLIKAPKTSQQGESNDLKAKAAKLEQTLLDFNVNAKVVQVTKGPAVTRYEIQPNTGVKVSSIVRLSDDIALNLEAKSIRMEAPIPGKAAVGIEVENERVNLVALREIIESQEFKTAKSKISFAVGKDIAGKSIVADLKSMPHMLIAGSTGSGKSVCINSIIISLLYKAKPDEVKLVLIDPKVVELGNYNGIPHLLIPVVTEPNKAAAALNWAVAEMTDRYKKFAEEGVRDLESFNNKVTEKCEKDRFLPQVVIIIDELADLMMAAPSQVEESICRLAQMARAAGMHLIVATQRPSVDIITGVIKANIPSRIAFAVSSQFDSRTILDMAGAEKLVGKGDMLFNPIGTSKPIRVQGTFISDSEVHNVIDFIKNQSPETEYAKDVIHTIEKVQTSSTDEDCDELLSEAIETVVRAKQASVSMLQRRFRIGYNRAARLVDMMESRGIIGPADGSRPRAVLMTEEEFLGLSDADETELENK